MKFIEPGQKIDLTVFVKEQNNGEGLRLATKDEIQKYVADRLTRIVNLPPGEFSLSIPTEIGEMILTNAPQRFVHA